MTNDVWYRLGQIGVSQRGRAMVGLLLRDLEPGRRLMVTSRGQSYIVGEEVTVAPRTDVSDRSGRILRFQERQDALDAACVSFEARIERVLNRLFGSHLGR